MKQVQKGFTLIELMIVVAIIGILAAVAIPAYQDYITKAKVSKVTTAVSTVQTAIAMYAQENGGAAALTGIAADPWTSLGLGTPTATTEVTAVDVTATTGEVVATLAQAVTGTVCTIGFTPHLAVGATALTWTVATAASTGTACPAPVPAIIAKWN